MYNNTLNFGHGDDIDALREMVRRFAQERIAPLALPRIIEVSEAEWEAEGFGPESGLAVLRDVDHGLIAKVNVDNRFLKASLARSLEHDREVIRRRFIYGLVLIGVSLWEEFKERDDADDQIRATTKAVARVLVPTITVLGALDAVRSEVP